MMQQIVLILVLLVCNTSFQRLILASTSFNTSSKSTPDSDHQGGLSESFSGSAIPLDQYIGLL